ncbi:MAG: hypothetical protein HYY26_01995 [Acidobacteria bacterium]|nr:hypothetical protein [Acidobacteriota bacterium]
MVTTEEEELQKAVLRLSARVLGVAVGLLFGGGLFVATNWLVVKGGDGQVGPHLGLLAQYFPGYTVTFVGSLVGFVYAFVVGFVVGTIIAYVYNWFARA